MAERGEGGERKIRNESKQKSSSARSNLLLEKRSDQSSPGHRFDFQYLLPFCSPLAIYVHTRTYIYIYTFISIRLYVESTWSVSRAFSDNYTTAKFSNTVVRWTRVVIASTTSGLTDSPLNAFRAALHGYCALLRHVSFIITENIFAVYDESRTLNDRFAQRPKSSCNCFNIGR